MEKLILAIVIVIAAWLGVDLTGLMPELPEAQRETITAALPTPTPEATATPAATTTSGWIIYRGWDGCDGADTTQHGEWLLSCHVNTGVTIPSGTYSVVGYGVPSGSFCSLWLDGPANSLESVFNSRTDGDAMRHGTLEVAAGYRGDIEPGYISVDPIGCVTSFVAIYTR